MCLFIMCVLYGLLGHTSFSDAVEVHTFISALVITTAHAVISWS